MISNVLYPLEEHIKKKKKKKKDDGMEFLT